MPGTITPLGIAALALLAERPMHPYEMYQLLIARKEDHLVKVRPGSLYHTVDRLNAAGYVRALGTEREGNRPERTTYEITEPGQLALTERVTEMLSTPAEEFPEFPLAIGEAHNLPRESVLSRLRIRLRHLESTRDFYRGGQRSILARDLPRKLWLDVPYQLAMLDAQVDWITALLAELESGSLEW